MALDSKQVKKDNVTPEKVTSEKKPVLPKSKENQVLKKRLVLLSVKIGFFILVFVSITICQIVIENNHFVYKPRKNAVLWEGKNTR